MLSPPRSSGPGLATSQSHGHAAKPPHDCKARRRLRGRRNCGGPTRLDCYWEQWRLGPASHGLGTRLGQLERLWAPGGEPGSHS